MKSTFLLALATRIALLSVGILTGTAAAQDPFGADPFQTNPNPFGSDDTATTSPFNAFGQPPAATPTASDSSTPPEQDPDPVVRMLRASPPQSPKEMANGLTWMVRLKRWDEVRRLLDLASAANWSLDEQAELARAAGAALWVRITNDEAELTDAQRQLVRSIASAPAKLARDPKWLDSWIDRLSSPSAGERRLAQLRLQDGGLAAIQRLSERLLDGDSNIDHGLLAGTIAEFGRDGVDALRAACLVSDADRAGRVFLSLAELPGNQFSVELGSGLASTLLSEEQRSQLSQALERRYGKVPSTKAIHTFLSQQFADSLAEYQQVRSTEERRFDIVWRQTPDHRSITWLEAQTKDRWLERAAQLAAHRLLLTVATTADQVDCGAVILQRAYQSRPELAAGEVSTHMITPIDIEPAAAAAYWIQVFNRASELQMHGGAIRALQMLVESAGGNYLVPVDFLSELLDDSRPAIRYTALETIAVLNPEQSFAGAEKTLKTAFEMSRLGSGPHALVIGMRAEPRQVAQQQLQQQTGSDVTAVHSLQAALLALDGADPIELIAIVDRPADRSLYELLQRLRSSKRGSSLPIAVLTDELYSHERELIAATPGVVPSVLSRNPEQMQRVIGLLNEKLDTTPLSDVDRIQLSRVASQFLSRIASDRDKYAFYPLADWREELENLGRGLPTVSQFQLLSGLGSAVSQRELADLSTNSSLSVDERLEAARAFGRSVRRFGMLLSRDDILRTYERYNTLGPDDPTAVKSIGLTLDIVEANAGKKSWPEGL